MNAFAGLIAGGARLITGVQVSWLDGMPAAGQAIYFANHTSHLDFVVLWSSLPAELRARTRPAAAADYWSHGFRRKLAVDVFNAVLVSRHEHNGDPGRAETAARETIERIAEEIGDRYSLIIFPEGTRGTGETVAPFKSGLYYLCLRKPGIALIPAYIENLNRILPKGEFLPVPFISRVRFGKTMFLEPSEPKREFLQRARDAVCRLHGS
ncbi:MAG: 1-acyl-sn-glycerol-3-phosphate acyltransferase [Candidatus Eremiobacteraeota bacterium]|nr:1-acyl-sn-glycerol-3-phosphate acyltransferase [Candidatus Eremiobacteraeota bacterium]